MMVAPPKQVQVRAYDLVVRKTVLTFTPSLRLGEVPFLREYTEPARLRH